MKVIALNSSARVGIQSKTELLLNALVEGVREAGGDVEIINLHKKKINYCIGCFTCWTKTPGKCIHNDDMTNELFPKFTEADLAVLATPLFHFTMNAEMKTFIERTLPVVEPFIRGTENGKSFHPLRTKHPAFVVLSVAGFPEMHVFDQLSSYFRNIYAPALVGEIYRPGAETLTTAYYKDQLDDVLDGCRQAGAELVKTMKISQATLDKIQQPIKHVEKMSEMGNCFWETCIEEGVTPREFEKKGLIPRPGTISTFLTVMEMGFNPEAAREVKACIQFDFSGKQQGSCYMEIENGLISTGSGAAGKPDLVIKTPFETWMDAITGKADGAELFMSQKYTIEGDLELLTKFSGWFGSSR